MTTIARVSRIPTCVIDPSHGPATVDGKTRMGPWACMCEACFALYGVGLGTGKGQRLELAP